MNVTNLLTQISTGLFMDSVTKAKNAFMTESNEVVTAHTHTVDLQIRRCSSEHFVALISLCDKRWCCHVLRTTLLVRIMIPRSSSNESKNNEEMLLPTAGADRWEQTVETAPGTYPLHQVARFRSCQNVPKINYRIRRLRHRAIQFKYKI